MAPGENTTALVPGMPGMPGMFFFYTRKNADKTIVCSQLVYHAYAFSGKGRKIYPAYPAYPADHDTEQERSNAL